ncbi:MAG TPA: beta-ribofuranosylaminobenzene 5'-phosphate synthase family protein [Methylophilaceae bacterium]|nr:beta-ribofuranosylaminobenzene 5'-phosphate synthase family protein [Methylophilaceae bacterium]HSI29539.1 beta-ribofuranosylaminobenzene 5'-phosphate synthase family protein [Methylophilus sp.]
MKAEAFTVDAAHKDAADSELKPVSGVSVVTTARLHMGFFDLNGGLGRRFGSIGVSLQHPATVIHAYPAATFTAEGAGAGRAVVIAQKIAHALNLKQGMHMQLKEVIPEHAGLGSGTQMSLGIGSVMNRLYQLGLGIKDIALLSARGARSGIGLGTFLSGGVVVDGGRGAATKVPPTIARMDFPEAWRIVLIFDHDNIGVHGEQEIEAFRSLPEFPADIAASMCRYVLMQALPALAESDLVSFGAAIRELQMRTGDYFAPVQSGRYASSRIAKVLAWLEAKGVVCSGQSSWGPTSFAIFADKDEAETMLQQLRTEFANQQQLEFMLCKGHNQGAILQDLPF